MSEKKIYDLDQIIRDAGEWQDADWDMFRCIRKYCEKNGFDDEIADQAIEKVDREMGG